MPGAGARRHREVPKPRVENPGKLMGRLLKYVGKNYGIHLVIVAVCIFVSVIANVQGTMFMKNLIDRVYHATDRAEQSGFRSAAWSDPEGCGILYDRCSGYLFL